MVIFQLLFFVVIWMRAPLESSAVTSHATVYFSPDDQLDYRLIEEIEKESKSIYVCSYNFTHQKIANALIDAKKRGVEVEVIVDRFSVKNKAPLQKLADAGIPVYVWDPDRMKRKMDHRPLMHNKFCVFGTDRVWTGSFNLTYEASKLHQENALVLQDAALAAAFKGQFQTIKLRSCIPYRSYAALLSKKKMTARKK